MHMMLLLTLTLAFFPYNKHPIYTPMCSYLQKETYTEIERSMLVDVEF